MRVNQLVGIPYDPHNFDCADFVIMVQKEIFGRIIELPASRPRRAAGQRKMVSISQSYVEPTDSPVDGDLVLMTCMGSKWPDHVGVYFTLDYEPWVLHCNESDGHSVLHRLRELSDFSVKASGFYRWKTT